MNKWKWLKVKDVCKFIGGSQPPKSLFSSIYQEGYVRLVQTRDFKTDNFLTYIPKKSTNKFFERKDIMIGRYGPPIFQIFRGMEGAYNVALLKAKPLSNIDNDFLYYFLIQKHVFNYIDQLSARTGGQTGVDLESLYEYPINLPDLSVQRKISAVLLALDNKIGLNKKINAELESIAITLYDYWFVQFDFPDENGNPYKSSGGEMLYSEILAREIPIGWEVTSIDYYADIIDPHPSHRAPIEVSNGFPFAGIGDIDESGNIDLNKARVINEEFVLKQEKDYSINEHSIGYGRVGTVGKVVKLRKLKFRYALSPTMAIINPKQDGFPSFVYFTVQNPIFLQWVEKYTSGSTRPAIGIQHLRTIPVIKPNETAIHLMEKFESTVKVLLSKSDVLTKQNQELASLRDWLLPMLMNGQVSIREIYEQVEEVLSMAAEPEVVYRKDAKLNIPKKETGFAKQVLAGKIVSLFKDDTNFTPIKFQKLQYLAEHIAEADLNWNYYYQSAGPYDNRFMHSIDTRLERANWFVKNGKNYSSLSKSTDIESYYQVFFNPVANRLEKLFSYFHKASEAQSEIVATLYAVWNNLIIQQQQVSDEKIIQNFYKWSERKEQYKQEQLLSALKWMRENDLVPTGFGKEIKKAKK